MAFLDEEGTCTPVPILIKHVDHYFYNEGDPNDPKAFLAFAGQLPEYCKMPTDVGSKIC